MRATSWFRLTAAFSGVFVAHQYRQDHADPLLMADDVGARLTMPHM